MNEELTRQNRFAVSRRLIWPLAGAPLTFAVIVHAVTAALVRWPQHGNVLVLASVAALVVCIYTGARSVFAHLSWRTPVRIALCVVYTVIAYFVLSFAGFIAAFWH